VAISEKMHVSKQTRILGQAATERVTLVQGNPPNREAFLSIRLWNTTQNGEAVPLYWDSGTPAVCLTADLIASSEGEPVSSDGGVLVTSFHSDHQAISAARRLQWAMQGFAESRDLQGISVVVLVHSAEELSTGPEGDSLRAALDHATGGQILLTEKASQFFEDLPGFASQTLDGTGLRELQWRSPDSHSTRAADDEWLNNNIRSDRDEPIPEPPAPEPEWSSRSSAEEEHGAGSGLSNPKVRWAIGGMLAAALVGGGIFFFMSGKPKPVEVVAVVPPDGTPQPPVTHPADNPHAIPPPSGPGSGSAPVGGKTPKPTKPKPPKPEGGGGDQPKPVPPPEPKPVPPPEPKPEPRPRANCNLDPGEYDKYLKGADNALGNGDTGTAKRKYTSVLNCDPGNARARDGLRKANGEY